MLHFDFLPWSYQACSLPLRSSLDQMDTLGMDANDIPDLDENDMPPDVELPCRHVAHVC